MAFNPNNPTSSGLVLTFDDEFNSASVATSSGTNGAMWSNHLWYDAPQNSFSVANGVLNLYGSTANSDPLAVSFSTENSSGGGFTQKFGYFEADIKVPGGQGTWPSFWLFNANKVTNGGAVGSEIDIMEGQGNTPNGYFTTLHSNTGGNDQFNANNGVMNLGENLSSGFHRYGLLWDPNSANITFFLDGVAVKTVPKFASTDSTPMQMILTSGIGDMIGTNQPNGSTPHPADMQVDYVRAYQFTSQNPHAISAQTLSTAAGNTDPTALANALGTSGNGSSASNNVPPPAVTTPAVTTPAPVTAPTGSTSTGSTGTASTGTGPDTLVLHVSGDKFQGDAQFTLMVDGKQVGGIQDVTAAHSAGQWQDITVHGSFANAHTLTVNYQDQWGGSASQDRNLYVGSVTVDGHTLNGDQATSNTANNGYLTTAHGYAAVEPHTAIMDATGSATFNITGLAAPVVATTTPPPAPTPAPASSGSSTGGTIVTDPGTGPDTLVVHLTGDQWQGNPQFTLSVDGKVIGGPQDVVASHAAGQWQDVIFHGDFSQAKIADITFLNDAWNGSLSQDRNIYVDSITLDGHQLTGSQATSNTASNGAIAPLHAGDAVMDVNGTLAFNVAGLAASSSTSLTAGSGPTTNTTSLVDPGTGPDTLLVHISGDQWQGNPQFTLTVDGKQIASAQGVTVSHAAGQWQDVIFHGDFANAHEADINFTNDAWGGTAGLDRNVYVSSITLDGHQLTGAQATSNTATNGMIKDATPGDAVMDVNGKLACNVTGFASSLAPSATDAAGHDVFVFNAPTQSGAFISTFDPGHDVLDLSTFLKAEGYTGTDPLADHVINLVQSGSNTAVTFDPTGHAANHGTTAITLDHVLPQDLHASNFVFHH